MRGSDVHTFSGPKGMEAEQPYKVSTTSGSDNTEHIARNTTRDTKTCTSIAFVEVGVRQDRTFLDVAIHLLQIELFDKNGRRDNG